MIAGWLDLIVWFFLDIRDIIKFTEYKKFDVEKEDGDMENINYEGKTADNKVDQSRKSSLNWMGNQRSYLYIFLWKAQPYHSLWCFGDGWTEWLTRKPGEIHIPLWICHSIILQIQSFWQVSSLWSFWCGSVSIKNILFW